MISSTGLLISSISFGLFSEASMPTLKLGSTGAAVTRLQNKLKELGFDPGAIDGKFGAGTKKALMKFQKSQGLTQDGVAGPETMEALKAAGSAAPSKPKPATGKPKVSTGTTAGLPALLTEEDFEYAADLLGCEVAAVK